MVRKQIKQLKGQFFYLMASLLVLLLIYPFLHTTTFETFASWFIGLIVFGAAIYADSDNTQHFFVAFSLGVSYLIFSLFSLFSTSYYLRLLSMVFAVVFFTYTVFLILDSMLKKREVTANTIFGSVSVYLLFGFIFAQIFNFIMFVNPSSLVSSSLETFSYSESLYYSFVTLTTLGFGDVIPSTALTQSLSIFEAVLGQLYLAVLVALLISNFIPNRFRKVPAKKYVQKKLK